MRGWSTVAAWLLVACAGVSAGVATHVRTLRNVGSEGRIAVLDPHHLVVVTRSENGGVVIETLDEHNQASDHVALGPDALVGVVAAHAPYVAISVALRAPEPGAPWNHSVRLYQGTRELWVVGVEGPAYVDALTVDAHGVVDVAGTFSGVVRVGDRALSSTRNPPGSPSLRAPMERFAARVQAGAASRLAISHAQASDVGCTDPACQWPAVTFAHAGPWMARVVSLNEPRMVNGVRYAPSSQGPQWLVLVFRTDATRAEIARVVEIDAGWIRVDLTSEGTLWVLASCAPEPPRFDGTTQARCGEDDLALLRF